MQLARLVRATGLGPGDLLAHPDVTEELLDICQAEDEARAHRRREEERQLFALRADQRFAAAAARARP